jgi:hypothetical protein
LQKKKKALEAKLLAGDGDYTELAEWGVEVRV